MCTYWWCDLPLVVTAKSLTQKERSLERYFLAAEECAASCSLRPVNHQYQQSINDKCSTKSLQWDAWDVVETTVPIFIHTHIHTSHTHTHTVHTHVEHLMDEYLFGYKPCPSRHGHALNGNFFHHHFIIAPRRTGIRSSNPLWPETRHHRAPSESSNGKQRRLREVWAIKLSVPKPKGKICTLARLKPGTKSLAQDTQIQPGGPGVPVERGEDTRALCLSWYGHVKPHWKQKWKRGRWVTITSMDTLRRTV